MGGNAYFPHYEDDILVVATSEDVCQCRIEMAIATLMSRCFQVRAKTCAKPCIITLWCNKFAGTTKLVVYVCNRDQNGKRDNYSTDDKRVREILRKVKRIPKADICNGEFLGGLKKGRHLMQC